ncbi:N-acetylmuramoyl-L-alanine amidase [Oryzihumus sp.]
MTIPRRASGRAAALGAVSALAAALALAPGGPATASPAVPAAGSPSGPASAPSSGPHAREDAFARAATQFGVPQSVLEAVSYSWTRWEGHAGQHSTDGGYGPMHLVDGAAFERDGRDGIPAGGERRLAADTLGRASDLLGVSPQVLRDDPSANILGGAALLADKQHALGLPTGTSSDPGAWYATVADASGSPERDTAVTFADDVYAVLAAGAARTTADGQAVSLPPTRSTPRRADVTRLHLAAPRTDPRLDCPPGLGCAWVPAPYAQYGPGAGDYGNHDVAHRPVLPRLTTIVIHDTESSWDTTLKLVQDPTYLAWNYTVRSSDGQVDQHLDPKDVGWHAGNWYVNAHSIGIEHEGFAAQGATWYSEPMYRASARLVRHLTDEYGIPRDRAHIIGHDQVPGTTPSTVAGMHWDPGPYWDWEHYFALMGAPLSARHGAPGHDVVRILPGFENNIQPVTGCTTAGAPCPAQGTNFVPLHTAPDASSPLVSDTGLHPDGSPSTTEVADIGARATAGVEYAVAGRSGDWTAIWYLGQKAWFLNPAHQRTAITVGGLLVTPKAGRTSVPVYGRAYPEASAYPAGETPQAVVPLQYSMAPGQRYVLTDAAVPTDYYKAKTFSPDTPGDHVDIVGQDRYYEVSFGHRVAYVRAADVDVVGR